VAEKEGLKKFDLTPSGRSSILAGAKYKRGFIVRPEQILSLFHDLYTQLAIPSDAKFEGIGIKDEGCDSQVEFYFSSVQAPWLHCFALKPERFFRMLVDIADGLIPLDSTLDGIEISRNFTVLLLRVSSSHWPAPIGPELPLYNLRYDLGRLLLLDPSTAIERERRIRIQ